VRLKRSGAILRAPLVISTANVYNTYLSLLSADVQRTLLPPKLLSAISEPTGAAPPSLSFFSLFLGLDGTAAELQLPSYNLIAFPTLNHAENLSESTWSALYSLIFGAAELDDAAIEAASRLIPASFIAFPTAKDPWAQARTPGKSSGMLLCPARNDWFKEWRDKKVKQRGERYNALKARITAILMRVFQRHYPQLRKRVVFTQLGTPESNAYYLGTTACYGMEHNAWRFSSDETAAQLGSACSPIPGLLMGGQDVSTCGVMGSAVGTLATMTAALGAPSMLYRLAQVMIKDAPVTVDDETTEAQLKKSE
jgi:all-trans-retinol 13,14-reductase